MEEIKNVLALFDSSEKCNAFIELSNMRSVMVEELKSRLLAELQKIADERLVNSGWEMIINGNVYLKPKETPLIGVAIEWGMWNEPWCRRGTCIWIEYKSINNDNVFDKIKSYKGILLLKDYEDNFQNHDWLPLVKQIPSRIFNVEDNITSMDECLFLAKDNAVQLATNLWKNVFEPFISLIFSQKLYHDIRH